jgi:hypothetical protein
VAQSPTSPDASACISGISSFSLRSSIPSLPLVLNSIFLAMAPAFRFHSSQHPQFWCPPPVISSPLSAPILQCFLPPVPPAFNVLEHPQGHFPLSAASIPRFGRPQLQAPIPVAPFSVPVFHSRYPVPGFQLSQLYASQSPAFSHLQTPISVL